MVHRSHFSLNSLQSNRISLFLFYFFYLSLSLSLSLLQRHRQQKTNDIPSTTTDAPIKRDLRLKYSPLLGFPNESLTKTRSPTCVCVCVRLISIDDSGVHVCVQHFYGCFFFKFISSSFFGNKTRDGTSFTLKSTHDT